jgi:hypothetical protein
LGSAEFVAGLRRRLAGKPPPPAVPDHRRLASLTIDEVLDGTADFYQVPRAALAARTGGTPRAAAAWLARRLTTATLNELATPLGLSHSGSVPNVTRRAERERAQSRSFRLELEQLEARLTAAVSPHPPKSQRPPSKEKTKNKT